jgi:nucleolar protein 16
VIHAAGRANPLNDPLNSDSEGEDEEKEEEEREDRPQNEIVAQLEEQARNGKEKKDRAQSEGEREWIARLVGKYGEDYGRMVRDRRLNPMQQTAADIKRRVSKWRANGGEVTMTE